MKAGMNNTVGSIALIFIIVFVVLVEVLIAFTVLVVAMVVLVVLVSGEDARPHSPSPDLALSQLVSAVECDTSTNLTSPHLTIDLN